MICDAYLLTFPVVCSRCLGYNLEHAVVNDVDLVRDVMCFQLVRVMFMS